MATWFESKFLLLVFFLVCRSLQAQDYFYTQFQSFAEKDGYLMLFPKKATQDNKGLLWIGSDNGLFSFDGIRFKHYRHNKYDSSSLPANRVNYNYQDRHGQYWVVVPDHGLYSFDPNTKSFTKFHYANEAEFDIHQHQIQRPIETKNGDLWFSLFKQGPVKWDRQLKKMIHYKLYPEESKDGKSLSILTMTEDPDDGSLWLTTNNGLANFFPDNSKLIIYKDKSLPEENSYTHLFIDTRKRIWVGSSGTGLKLFNRATHLFTTYKWTSKPNNTCHGIGQLNDRYLWVNTLGRGLFVFDTEEDRFRPLKGIEETTSLPLTSFFFQNEKGVVWLVSSEKLIRLHPANDKFVYHSVKTLLEKSSSQVSTYQLDRFIRNGPSLLIAFYNGSVVEYNETMQQVKVLFNHEIDVRNFSKDKQGLIWIGTNAGIYIFHPATSSVSQFKNITSLNKTPNISIWDILHEEDSSKWIATNKGLLHYYPAQKKEEWIYGKPDSNIHSNEFFVETLYKDKTGSIWFGTNKGLGCYQPHTGKVTFFNRKRNNSYPQQLTGTIAETPDGKILFVVPYKGLGVLSNPFTAKETIQIYNSSNGLPSDNPLYIFRDRFSTYYWLFTYNYGFCLLDASTMTVARHFTKEHGLSRNLIQCHPYQDEEGKIYIGFWEGFQVFDPRKVLNTPTEDGSIYLSALKINGKEWPEDLGSIKTLTLKHDSTNLSFEFAFLTKAHTPGYHYAYRLTRIEKDWNRIGTRSFGQYSNLPPGRYTLHIKATNESGTWNSREFVLPIEVHPPWYNSWWFYSLLALFIVLSVAGLFRYRIAEIKKENQLKNHYSKKINEIELRALRAQMNPHFIFNCLNSINRYIVKSDHKTASNYLTKFAKLIRLILDNSASDTITLDREIQTLQLYLDMERLRFDHAFDYEIDTDNILNPDAISLPSMLLQPYVENAIWHGLLHKQEGNGKLWIRLFLPSPSILQVEIEDNGVGRKKAKVLSQQESFRKKSYGMQISKERILLINEMYNLQAKVQIIDLEKNGEPAGTKVIVQIPLQRE